MLSMRKERKGFTLIELMIVVAIIGILAAIAIPQFAKMRQKGYDAATKSALGNIKTAQEAYFLEKNEYATKTEDLKEWYTPETGITLDFTKPADATVTGYIVTGTNTGSKIKFKYDSTTGQIEEVKDK